MEAFEFKAETVERGDDDRSFTVTLDSKVG